MRHWHNPDKDIKAIVIINHGMAEHSARYSDFAEYLNTKELAVYAKDHRGHGELAQSDDTLGYFADKNGWDLVVEDIRTLHNYVKKAHPNTPIIMFGHSMGSFLTRDYLSRYGNELTASIISGTGYTPAPILGIASCIANIQCLFGGQKKPSHLLDTLSFGAFNKPFKSANATGFEWLSNDAKQVKAYVDDPLCGFVCTPSFFRDLFHGLNRIQNVSYISKVSHSLPILFYSGKEDPVGDFGKGVNKVYSMYKKCKLDDLSIILKEGDRHECLNSLDRMAIYEELYNWMNLKLG